MIFTLLFSTIIVAVFSKCLTNNTLKQRKIQFFFLGLGFILFAGLRSWDTFTDTTAYYNYFSSVSSSGYFWNVAEHRFETGFLILGKFIRKYISSSPEIFVFIVSAIVLGSVFMLIKKEAKSIWFPAYLIVGLYLFISGLVCPVRQTLATAVCIWAYFCLKNEKRLVATLLILLATTLHSSAVLFMAIVPISFLEVNKRNALLIIVSAIVVFVGLGFILEFLGYGDSSYLDDESYQLGNILDVVKNSLILLYCSMCYKGDKDKYRIMIWLSVMAIVLPVLSLKITALNRGASYFEIYLLILLTNVLYEKTLLKRFLTQLSILIIAFLYLFVIYTERPHWNRINEYYTIWEHPYKTSSNKLLNIDYH